MTIRGQVLMPVRARRSIAPRQGRGRSFASLVMTTISHTQRPFAPRPPTSHIQPPSRLFHRASRTTGARDATSRLDGIRAVRADSLDDFYLGTTRRDHGRTLTSVRPQ